MLINIVCIHRKKTFKDKGSLILMNKIDFPFFLSCSTIEGRIDQVNQVLELDKESNCAGRYHAMDRWSNQIDSLQLSVINKMA